MSDLVVTLSERPVTLAEVGGKGLHLAEMLGARLPVPPSFCVTTAAFASLLDAVPHAEALLDAVDALLPTDVEGVRRHAAALRAAVEGAPLPVAVDGAVRQAYRALIAEGGDAVAVRSSATLEDLPDASFAGQQDTYLWVRGEDAVVDKVRACMASLFTDRAVLYRRQHGYPSRAARLAVVVQRMVRSDLAGILFTADPVTQHRGVCSIDASYGLGEAVVSGIVDADLYRVDKRTGALLEVQVGDKAVEIVPASDRGGSGRERGGVEHLAITDEARREARVLDDAKLRRLVDIARQVEEAQGSPQDIEWCFEGDELFLVQTRPITSLYPRVDPVPHDGLHAYLSFGHVQVMTEPIRPLAVWFFHAAIPFGRRGPDESDTIKTLGERIYLDVTPALRTFPFSRVLPRVFSVVEGAVGSLVRALLVDPRFLRRDGRPKANRRVAMPFLRAVLVGALKCLVKPNPEDTARELAATLEGDMARFREQLESAPTLLDRLERLPGVCQQLFPVLFRSFPPKVVVGVLSWRFLSRFRGRLAEHDVEALTRGFDGNVTTEMDLELGDLADLARACPPLVAHLTAHLESAPAATAVETARGLPGAEAFHAGWDRFLEKYGHRCPGEIDLTNPRWREDPSSLVQSLIGMLHAPEPGLHRRKHQEGAARAAEVAEQLVAEAGPLLRPFVRRAVRMVRGYLAVREHGKYYALQLFDLVRRTFQEAAEEAIDRGLLREESDVFYLTRPEVVALLEGRLPGEGARALVDERRSRQEQARRLRPPRVVTSDGDIPVPLEARAPLPPGAMRGLAASSGVVEGVARVVLDPRREVLHHGEILVAPFTDPGWTPLFIHAAGLVMEVGGLMTHGSVVAREYGIPAVVGVDDALARIQTGQRIRVDGTTGIVTLLDGAEASEPVVVQTEIAA